jgi:hypothetical protein
MSQTDAPPSWVHTFQDWAEGRTQILNFEGAEVPERLQALLTALEPTYHRLTLTEGSWNIQHPLECRPNLGDCRFNLPDHVAEALFRSVGPGRYRMEKNDDPLLGGFHLEPEAP